MRFVWVFLLGLISQLAFGAPKSEYWDYFDHFQPVSQVQINHSSWDAWLKKYLIRDASGTVRVRYAEVTDEDRNRLDAYIGMLSGTDPRQLSRDDAQAYWINLYNALTVRLILNNYPLESITKLGKGWFSFGPWDDPVTRVAGQTLTLNDIEHRILRPLWKDYRIHYAVNCASVGCPNLKPEAWDGSRIDAQLTSAEADFLALPKSARREGDNWILSSIYDWYAEDFGGKAGVIRHLSLKRPGDAASLEDAARQGNIRYDYDWSLNEWPVR